MPVLKLVKCPLRSPFIRTNKTKSLSEIYQWDFEIQKIPMPKIVVLNNMSLNSDYTYDNYYKRHLEALPPQSDFRIEKASAGESLAGEPKKTESLSVLDIRTKPEVLEKWVSTSPKAMRSRKEWFKVATLSKDYDV